MGNNHYFCFVLYIQINEFFPMYTILIIEDDPRVASLLMNGLEENGYQTMVAYDGLMGLRLFQTHTFDLVISDIVLPKMDGFELAKYDLSLRREGDILGNRQSGASVLKLVNIVRDERVIEAAHADAAAIMQNDPQLESPDHRALAQEVRKTFPK